MSSEVFAEIILLGGKVIFAKGQTSSYGVKMVLQKSTGPLSIKHTICFN